MNDERSVTAFGIMLATRAADGDAEPRDNRTKICTTVYFTAAQHQRLAALTLKTGVARAVHMRLAIERYLDREESAQ